MYEKKNNNCKKKKVFKKINNCLAGWIEVPGGPYFAPPLHYTVFTQKMLMTDSPPIGEQQEQWQGSHCLKNWPITTQHHQPWQQELCHDGKETTDHFNHETMGRITQLQSWRTHKGRCREDEERR